MEHEAEIQDVEILFEMPVEIDLAKSEGEGKRCIAGYGTTEALDKDREQILLKGMDYGPLQQDGFVNYDHQRRIIGGVKVPMIIGIPTHVEMRLEKGLWIEAELLQGDPMSSEQMRLANEMWELGMALKKAGGGRRLSYSIEGHTLDRRGGKLVRTVARHVALTHKPVNPTCSVEVFAKSFCCGKCSPDHPQYNPAHKCGNKHHEFADGIPHLTVALEKAMSLSSGGATTTERTSALIRENIDRGLSTVLYGGNDCPDCFDPSTGRFKDGVAGALKHMVNCMGHGKENSYRLLKRLLQGAEKNPAIATLCKQAGFVRG